MLSVSRSITVSGMVMKRCIRALTTQQPPLRVASNRELVRIAYAETETRTSALVEKVVEEFYSKGLVLSIPSSPTPQHLEWLIPPSLSFTSTHPSKGIDCVRLKKQLQFLFPQAEICCECGSGDTHLNINITIPNYTKYL